jgi:hypothetical protein
MVPAGIAVVRRRGDTAEVFRSGGGFPLLCSGASITPSPLTLKEPRSAHLALFASFITASAAYPTASGSIHGPTLVRCAG